MAAVVSQQEAQQVGPTTNRGERGQQPPHVLPRPALGRPAPPVQAGDTAEHDPHARRVLLDLEQFRPLPVRAAGQVTPGLV
jgi:hypothetical protein